jgi:hypothetical protein
METVTGLNHKIEAITFEKQFMMLTVDGKSLKIDLNRVSKVLASAPDNLRYDYETSPAGYGIHWNRLDEDLSIDGLLKIG